MYISVWLVTGWNATTVVSGRSKVNHHVNVAAAHRILECTSFAKLRKRIHHTMQELDRVSEELLQTRLSVSARLNFKHLYTNKPPTDKIDIKKVVINLTDRELDPAAVSMLSKGLNFAQTADSIANLKETFSSIE